MEEDTQVQPEKEPPGNKEGASRKHVPVFFNKDISGKKNSAKRTASRSAEVDRRHAALASTRPTSKGVLEAKAKTNSRPCTPVKDRPKTEVAKVSSSSSSQKTAQVKAHVNTAELEKDKGHPTQTRAHAEWPSVADTGTVPTVWKTSYLDSLDDGPQEMETSAHSVETRTYRAPEPGEGREEPQEARKKAEPEHHARGETGPEQPQPAAKEQTPEEFERNWAETMRNEAKTYKDEIRTRTEQRNIRIQAEAEMVTTHRPPMNLWIGTELKWQKRGRAAIKAGEYEEKGPGDRSNRAREHNRFTFTAAERK